jgi:hypothetical protein
MPQDGSRPKHVALLNTTVVLDGSVCVCVYIYIYIYIYITTDIQTEVNRRKLAVITSLKTP